MNCSAEQIKHAAGSYLATDEIIFSTIANTPTVAGLVRLSSFSVEFRKHSGYK